MVILRANAEREKDLLKWKPINDVCSFVIEMKDAKHESTDLLHELILKGYEPE
jgi:hypothetical protein